MRRTLLSAVLSVLPAAAMAQDWWVIVGYTDHAPFEWTDAVLVQGERLEARLSACGLGVIWDFAGKFDGFDTGGRGTVFVLNTQGSLSKGAATRLLAATKPCVADAYIKQARYFGE